MSGERRIRFDFRVRSTGTLIAGDLELRLGNAEFESETTTTFVRSGSSATWTGTGTWNDHAGYSFTAAAVDARVRTEGRMNPDRLTVTIRDASGATVLSFSESLRTGDILVNQATGVRHRLSRHEARCL